MSEEIVKDRMELDDYNTHYHHNFYCVNCGKHFGKWIRKGHRVPNVSCPNCECIVTR